MYFFFFIKKFLICYFFDTRFNKGKVSINFLFKLYDLGKREKLICENNFNSYKIGNVMKILYVWFGYNKFRV